MVNTTLLRATIEVGGTLYEDIDRSYLVAVSPTYAHIMSGVLVGATSEHLDTEWVEALLYLTDGTTSIFGTNTIKLSSVDLLRIQPKYNGITGPNVS